MKKNLNLHHATSFNLFELKMIICFRQVVSLIEIQFKIFGQIKIVNIF